MRKVEIHMASRLDWSAMGMALLLWLGGCQTSNTMNMDPAFGAPAGATGASGSGGGISAVPAAGTTGTADANVAVMTAGTTGSSTAGTETTPPPITGSSGAAAGTAGVIGEMGGMGGSVAAAGAGGAAPFEPWKNRADLGKGDGSDVVTIGDSWMDYFLGGGGIQSALDRAGTRYRHYALSGTQLLDGVIPNQYDRAKGINPDIKTVIMTGGGNDIMFDAGSCSTPERCADKVKEISAALDKLWTKMSADGVKDVVYIRYAEGAGTTPDENRPKTTDPIPICLTGPIICHSLNTTDLVMGSLVDGIHPTASANDRIAAALIQLMEMRGVRR